MNLLPHLEKDRVARLIYERFIATGKEYIIQSIHGAREKDEPVPIIRLTAIATAFLGLFLALEVRHHSSIRGDHPVVFRDRAFGILLSQIAGIFPSGLSSGQQRGSFPLRPCFSEFRLSEIFPGHALVLCTS